MAQAQESLVVVDASIVFKWFVVEEDSYRAIATLGAWLSRRVRLAAPYFMVAEVANAFHRRVRQGQMSVEQAGDGVEEMLSPRLAIELHAPTALYRRALNLTSQLSQTAVYDCIYLALAEALDGQLWTADERFYRAASLQFSNVRWLGEANVPS